MSLIKSLALGLFGCFALSVNAADVPIPRPANGAVSNPNYLEYQKTGNTYTWQPVGTTTPPGSGTVSFPSSHTISDAVPKVTTTGDLPYQHKGGSGVKVTITRAIDKAKVAAAAASGLAAAAAAKIKPGNPYVTLAEVSCVVLCPFAIEALADWGINKLKANGDGTFSVSAPDAAYVPVVSDGMLWSNNGFDYYFYSQASACSARGGVPANGHYGCNVPTKSGGTVYVSVWRKPSTCASGNPVVNGVCGGQAPNVEVPLADFIDSKLNDYSDPRIWPTYGAVLAAAIFQSGKDIFTDGTSIHITGPDLVPVSTSTSSWPVNVLPGTTTPAPPGHTGPTDSGTQSTTTTTTATNTFRPGTSGSASSGSGSGPAMTTAQTTTTTTSITNNITNVTNITNETTTEKDEAPEESARDTPLSNIPELYKQKYPDGLLGVWNSFKTNISQTSFVRLISELTPNIGSGGSCPVWTFDLGFIPGASMGVHRLGAEYCFIWPVLKIILMITALFTARRLIFGG